MNKSLKAAMLRTTLALRVLAVPLLGILVTKAGLVAETRQDG
jgi:hypothetical protein